MLDRSARHLLSALLSVTASLGAAFAPAHAQLRVEITGVGSNQFPIAVANFQREGSVPQEVHEIVREDLKRSGMFRNIDAGSTPVAETAQVNLGDWKGR